MKRVLLGALLWLIACTATAKPYTKNVAIVIYEGVEILDFAGPAEVFEMAANYGRSGEEKAFRVYTVSKTKSPIVSQGFIDVVPDYSIADAPKPDILVLPGGGAQKVVDDAEWMAWVRTVSADAEHVLTVCSGAFILGKAGLLDGLEATTWYNAVPALAKEFPNTKVHPGRRFVDNGKIITTAGVSAGIDGSLHLVARLLGRYVADRTAEYMEYKWSPESYHSSKYSVLNPQLDRRGRSLQQASILAREGDRESAVAIYRSLIETNRDDAQAWLDLGRALQAMKRYPEAIEAHREAAKGASQRATALYNLSCALAQTGKREEAIQAASQAIDAGFRVKWLLQNDEDLATIREDPRFMALISSVK